MKRITLSILLMLFVFSAYCQQKITLIAPTGGAVIANNMPTLSWAKVACTQYEVWIDGIKMDIIQPSQHAYVPFPLSFGKHSWKVVAVTKSGRLESNAGVFSIDDVPLTDVPANALLLRNNWLVKSSLEVGFDGAQMSASNTNTKGWASTSVPATVLTALVRNGIYPNPYIGTNNLLIPDISDEFNTEYDLLKYSHIPNKNPWKAPYWFRNEFAVPAGFSGKSVWLNFSEINYKAQVWLNGVQVADTATMVGMERQFRFDVTKLLKKAGKNVLAVAIFPPNHPGKPSTEPLTPLANPGTNMADGLISHDYTKWDVMGWDWQPSIRDRDMGITEDVFLSVTDQVEINDIYATSNLALPDTTSAYLTVSANLVNKGNAPQEGVMKVVVSNEGREVVSFNQPYKLKAKETKEFMWDSSTNKVLHLTNPKLWWPTGYGKQNLYTVTLSTLTNQKEAATAQTTFGIRKVETYIGANERVYKINGRDIYAKGGNWVIDMMLNWNASRYEKEILLTRNANLNMLRIWGPTGIAPKALYDAADKYGILIWQDFLNDFWGTMRNTPGFQPEISLYEKATIGIVKKYRNHPSLVIWCGGNEGLNPRQDLIMNSILKKYDNRDSRHYLKESGGDGLHGGGPYNTLEPKDYFTHRNLKGFSSEIGPSGVPVYESMQKFMPEMGEKPWAPGRFPIDGVWAYHDANDWPGNDPRKFSSFDNIVTRYYGATDSTSITGVENYMDKSQLVNYDVYRASIEAINRQLWTSASGILLWKSNSSWPSITWQVYDWYLQSHAGYYGAKKASELVHVQLNRDNMSVSVLNLLNKNLSNLSIKATLVGLNMEAVWTTNKVVSVESNTALNSGIIVPNSTAVQFLKLTATDSNGNILSENFYWLNSSNDFKALNSLPVPKLEFKANSTTTKGKYQVTISNKGKSIAFMVALKLVGRESKQEILPSLWSENYISLLPGESKTVQVEIDRSDLMDEVPALESTTYGKLQKNYIEVMYYYELEGGN